MFFPGVSKYKQHKTRTLTPKCNDLISQTGPTYQTGYKAFFISRGWAYFVIGKKNSIGKIGKAKAGNITKI